MADQQVQASIALGRLADTTYQQWREIPEGATSIAAYVSTRHPTYPDSASSSGQITKAEGFARLCESWNECLNALHPVITPDAAVPLRKYGATITAADLMAIPARDQPPGLPDWMCALDAWAKRTGKTAQMKRATITVKVPRATRTWPPIA